MIPLAKISNDSVCINIINYFIEYIILSLIIYSIKRIGIIFNI